MDRTSWIIIAICGVLLGLGFFSQKQTVDEPVQAPAVQQTAAPAPTPDILPQRVGQMPQAGLVVQKPASESNKTTWELASRTGEGDQEKIAARFVFSSIGGGIEYVELPDQMIDSKLCRDHLVRINEGGTTGMGTLVFGVDGMSRPVYDTGNYTRIDEESSDTKLVLTGKPFVQGQPVDTLLVRKEYTLVPVKDDSGKEVAGNAYMLRLKVTLHNPQDYPVSAEKMGLYAGANGPVNQDEPEMYTHFFWKADGSYNQETPSYFSGGWFGSARSRAFEQAPSLEYAGVMGQFFTNILIPGENARGEYVYAEPKDAALHNTTKIAKDVELVVSIPTAIMPAKGLHTLTYDFYTGPKHNQMLGELPGTLDDVMGYGWLTLLSWPMNWLLNIFHGLFGNWGWAVIGMTIVVRTLIWPLHRKSFLSMKRMSQLQPEIAQLREKYPNDPQKVNMEMMQLYQKYGINPMGGCLPMLIQIPIFFAFYRVLQSATEMRGEPFILWIKDLARPDTVLDINLPFSLPLIGTELPLNILPIIMAGTMILQMRLTPKAGDKMQQRIMNLMPIMFFAFCYNFASALALYWTTQNIISIGQNFLIRRLPEPKLEASRKPKKKGFFQRMMEQQQKMMEEQQRQQKKGGGGNMKNVTPKK